MADSGFNTGSVVRLKSGGPKMTITAWEHERAICTYFRNDGGWGRISVHTSTLTLVREEGDIDGQA